MQNFIRIKKDVLKRYVSRIFVELGVPKRDAEITADVLVSSDMRGIESHGVARLTRYVDGLKNKKIATKAKIKVIKKTVSTLLLDGGNGLGQVVAYKAMEMCIKKAKKTGLALVGVRNSNHFGIAGYYSMMALKHNMIGISMTNSRPLAVPTYGREAIIGTNPISFAAPAGKEMPFVLDMATSVVPIGKIEVANRKGKKIPVGWAVDKKGLPTNNAGEVLSGGAVLPLGGDAEFSGYKGYGLSVMIDILCGVLTGTGFLNLVKEGSVGHVFCVIDIAKFRGLRKFTSTMDEMIRMLKNSVKAEGEDRIFIAGEKEFEKEREYMKNGILLDKNVFESIQSLLNGRNSISV